MSGGCDAGAGNAFGDDSFVREVVERAGFNAERVAGDGAVSSGGVPGIGTASRTVGVPSVGVVPTFGATRRDEIGVAPACVGGTVFNATGAFATGCGVPFVVLVGTVCDVSFVDRVGIVCGATGALITVCVVSS